MKHTRLDFSLALPVVLFFLTVAGVAQEATISAVGGSAVPRVVNFSGTITGLDGKPLTSISGVTFSLYKDAQGGAPLWLETQSVQPDRNGHYTINLGSTTTAGLPADVFMTGEARWLGVQVQGQQEQPRVLLVAVPYALKAHDAETIGGLPASAFVLAAPSAASPAAAIDSSTSSSVPPPPATITGSGTAGFLPDFTGAATVGNSAVFQSGTSPTAKIGINTNAPTTTLDVHGGAAVRGTLALPASGAATAAAGKNSQPENFTASVFNSGTSTAVGQTFQLKAEAVGNDTAAASGSLNFLYGQGTAAPTETGLSISNKGLLSFAAGQTFPGTGPGTVLNIASGAGLTGGPITSSGTLSIANAGVTNAMLQHPSLTLNPGTDLTGGGSVSLGGSTTLNLDTTKVPTLAGSNVFTASQSLNGGALLGNTIQAADGTFSLLVNSVDCCDFGSRMVWAHSPAFPNWGIYYDDSIDYLHIRRQAGGEILTVDFSGLVGINNATPAQALDVNGNINTNSSVLAASNVTADGNVGGFTVSASARGTFGSSTASTTGQALIANNESGTQTLQVQNFNSTTSGTFVYAQFDLNGKATFYTDDLGDTVAAGTKSAAVPLASGEMVKVFSTESPEVWFEDYGFGKLTAGAATVTIDPSFTETASMTGYHVFVTPKGDCKGLYVTSETNGTFQVRELEGGQSNIEFDYRIVAHRKGYDAVRLPAAVMPKPVTAAVEAPKDKHSSLPPAKVAPNPQLLYRASTVAPKAAGKTLKK